MNDEILHATELFSLDDISFIEACYKLLLRRDPDSSGLRYYMGRLALGYTRESIIYDLTRSKEYDQKNNLIGIDRIIKRERMRQSWIFRIFANKHRNRSNGSISLGSIEKRLTSTALQILKKNEAEKEDGAAVNLAASLNTHESLVCDNKFVSVQHYKYNDDFDDIINVKASSGTLRIDDALVFGRPRFNKILAIKLDHRGDLILFHPALMKLRNRYPNAQIDVLVGSWNKEQLSLWGIVNNIITYDFFKSVSACPSQLNYNDLVIAMSKLDEYDLAIDFRRDSDTRFILQNIRAGFTIGYKSHNADIDNAMSICHDYNCLEPGVRVPENYTHMSYQLLKLVDSIPPHQTDYLDISCDRIIDSKSLRVGIFPYCGTSFRDWSTKNYKQLIETLLENNTDIVIDIYLVAEDNFFCEFYKDDRRVNILIGLGYNEITDSLSRCKVILSNNSYGGHLAGLLGVPSVIIFSGTELPHEWRPAYGRNVVIYHDIGCSPCHSNNVLQCPYDVACMDIAVADVYEQVSRILEDKQSDTFNGYAWISFKDKLFSLLPDKSRIGFDKLRDLHVAYANNHGDNIYNFDIVIAQLYGNNNLSAREINNLKILYMSVKPDGNCFETASGKHVSHACLENSVVFIVMKNFGDFVNYKRYIRIVSERNCTVNLIIDNCFGDAEKVNVGVFSDIGLSLCFATNIICADNEIDLLASIIEYGVQNADDACSVNLHSMSAVGRKPTEVISAFYPDNNSRDFINIVPENGVKTFFWFENRIHAYADSMRSENKLVVVGRGHDNSIWGPYVKLSAGIYYLDVYIEIYQGSKNLLIRVCSIDTEEFYSEVFLANPKEGNLKISIPFRIDSDVDKLEVLFSAAEGSAFSFSKYTIKKNDDYKDLSGDYNMHTSVPSRRVYSAYCAGCEYLTEVGKNDSYGNLLSNKNRGTLLYGQNITLKAGRYIAKIYGTVERLTGDEFISITSDRGSVKIVEHAPINGNIGELCEIIEFILTSKHEEVEVVMYVDRSTDIIISRVSIYEY